MFTSLTFLPAYERFDEQIRLIQNGSHPSPPIDPVIPALDKFQKDLEDIVPPTQLAAWKLEEEEWLRALVQGAIPPGQASPYQMTKDRGKVINLSPTALA